MPRTVTLTLRDVPEVVARALRARARRNGRSMQKELLALLEQTVVDRASLAERLAELRERVGAGLRVSEIDDAIDEGRP